MIEIENLEWSLVKKRMRQVYQSIRLSKRVVNFDPPVRVTQICLSLDTGVVYFFPLRERRKALCRDTCGMEFSSGETVVKGLTTGFSSLYFYDLTSEVPTLICKVMYAQLRDKGIYRSIAIFYGAPGECRGFDDLPSLRRFHKLTLGFVEKVVGTVEGK